jgi:hypothetical protein
LELIFLVFCAGFNDNNTNCRRKIMKLTKKIRLIVMMSFVSMLTAISLVQAQDNPTGTIVETMNSGGYSYALIDTDGKKSWVAVPQMVLGVGDEVEFTGGLEMGLYTSKTLGKTFDNIIFSGGVVAIKKAKKITDSDKPEEVLVIEKAAGDDAYTIAELYAQKDALAGKKVVVSGKVYKVSKFMGATWIRLKDGTGSRKKGNHKLVVTSQDTAEKDSTITVSGIMAVDKNFGGLSYEVVVEKATVQN